MTDKFYSPGELLQIVGQRAKGRRLALGRLQGEVAEAAGISIATLRRFEAGADVGVEAVVRVALALGVEDEIAALFSPPERRTLDEIAAQNRPRQRARARKKR